MKLIILMSVLLLARTWAALRRWCADHAAERMMHRARQRLADVVGSAIATMLLWLGAPLVLWGVITLAPQGLFGALVYLAVSIAVLLVLVAPNQAHHQVEALQCACTEDNPAAADAALAALGLAPQFDGRVASPLAADAVAEPALDNGAPEAAAARAPSAQALTAQGLAERIITLGFHEWFAVLFWFVLAGPAGALFYRLTDWFARPQPASDESDAPDAGCPRLAQVQALLDWPAARVYAALLLLAGGFNRGLDAWLAGSSGAPDSLAQANRDLIQRVGHAALELEREDNCDTAAICLADQTQWIKAAAAIVLRALLIGLGLVALLTLSSWVR
jgi:AmpE protein